MSITIPENIRQYIEDETTVPLIDIKGTLWYHITQAEKEALTALMRDLDSVPSDEFNSMPDSEKWRLSCAWNDANRIVRNSVIREA